jgi:DNA primase
MIDYQIEEVLAKSALSSHTGRIEAAANVVPIISQLKMAVNRMEYIRQLAGRINIREEELLSDVNLYRREHGLDKEERAAMRAANFQREGNYQGGQGFQRKGGNFKGGGGNFKGGGGFKGKKPYDRDRDNSDYEEPRPERPRFGGLDRKAATRPLSDFPRRSQTGSIRHGIRKIAERGASKNQRDHRRHRLGL